MAFTRFMASAAGRTLRILLGLVLVAAGYLLGGAWGIAVAVVGLVPILAGALNFCLLGPLFGSSFRGGTAARPA